jgi:hypothetical protein
VNAGEGRQAPSTRAVRGRSRPLVIVPIAAPVAAKADSAAPG